MFDKTAHMHIWSWRASTCSYQGTKSYRPLISRRGLKMTLRCSCVALTAACARTGMISRIAARHRASSTFVTVVESVVTFTEACKFDAVDGCLLRAPPARPGIEEAHRQAPPLLGPLANLTERVTCYCAGSSTDQPSARRPPKRTYLGARTDPSGTTIGAAREVCHVATREHPKQSPRLAS